MQADFGVSHGFPPIAGLDARTLILGSLPGRRSIDAGEYYAHPQNAFWPVMRTLCGVEGDYRRRCARLVECRVALWDVLAASERPGSMDADIRGDKSTANDFAAFLEAHSGIECIAFNGKAAGTLFEKLVAPDLELAELRLIQLPSTSPANARLTFDQKLAQWRQLFPERQT